MDNKSFIMEMHSYIENSYFEFNQYQNVVNEIFDLFHKLCKENKIPYYLAFGTLLGRVRDGGQIPWDYDYDICVPYNRIFDLINILKEKLPKEYFFDSNITNKNSTVYMLRIGKCGYDLMHLHLDIFYIFGAPNNKQDLVKFQKKLIKLFRARIQLYNTIDCSNGCINKIIRQMKNIIIAFPYTKLTIDQIFKRMCLKYEIDNSDNIIICAYNSEYFPKNIFGKPTLYRDSLGEYFGPEDREQFLKIRYGDYNNYLPIKDRFEEFYTFYKLIKESV